MPINYKVKQLYDALKEDGADVGSEQEFNDWFFKPGDEGYKNRRSVYDAFKEDGAVKSKDYGEFSKRLGLHAVEAQKQSPALTQDVRRPQAPLPQAATSVHAAAQKPAKPQPVQRQQTAQQPMTDMQKEMLLDNLQGIVNNARSSNTRTIQQMKNKLEYDKKSRNGFLGGPVEGGVQYNPSTGKMEQTYLTPQGYKTTSKGDADMMSQQYREQQAFRQRMKVNGLKPDNKEDVQKQMQLDEEKPMRDVLNDVWGEAEAQDKKAQEAWRNRADKNARGFSLSDAAAASSSAGAVFAGRGEDFNNDLEYQKKRHAIFDFDKMANTMYARLPEDYRRGTLERYTDYFKKHPKDAKGKTAAIAAKDALMGDLYRQVYERAKAQDMPKSKLEFLLRKIADQPLISSSMAANTVAAWQTGSHGLDLAEQDAMSTFGKQHKTLDIAGTVANMALDPVTYAAGGVGGVVGKKALQAVGKQALKGATKKVAERYAAGTLAGRVAQGAAGGAANFGTFNTVKGIQQQMAVGGTLDENGKPTNELSAGDILKETAHGLMLGAATGTLSPLIGNVADKAVKATSSTAGKVALRAGQTALSTLAEGTVFAIPDMVDKGKWDWDTWTDSQAMMLGFKASHAIKSAPRVLQGLQREDRRIGLNFEERLRKQLDASPADIGFKPEEMEELRDKGYTDLSMLFRDANKRKADKSTGIEERTDDYENLTPDRFDGYEAMKRLMNDNSVSEATRAKAYYILTGHMLPMSSVVGYDVEKDDAGRVTVNSVNARGGVVTTRRFANEKAAGQEIDNIARQAELNAVNVGEKYKETASNMIVMEQAIKEVAPDADVATVLNNYKMVKSGQLTDEAYVRQAQAIDEAIARNRHIADPNRPEAIREKIKKETGIDVDASLRKMPAKRTEKEQAVVDEYIRSLFPEEKAEKPNNGGYEQIEPDAHYNRGYKSADDESGDEMRRVKTDYDTKRNGMADKYGEDNLAAIDDDPIGWLDANADKMSDEDAHVVTDYVNARYAYLGMTQRANDDADDAAVSAAAAVDARANKDDNMVHPATLKDGGNVYIVSGNVVMSADGKSVDKGKSSKRIVVRDAQSGEMSMLPADDVIALDAPIDAQQERDAAAKAAAEQSRTASANVADGLTTHDNPQLGDEVYVRGDDGKPVRGIIRNVDSYTGDYMVETEAPIAGKKAQPFKAEQLYDMQQSPESEDQQIQHSAEASAAPVDSEQQKPETPVQPEDETEHQPQTEELQGSEQTAEVGQPASESEEAHTGETPARAIDKIPSEQVTDKKGNTRTVHHWEQAPAEDTYDAMTQDVFDGDAKAADDYANGMAERLDKEIKKLDKEIAKSKTGESLDDILEAKKRTQKLRDQREALQQRKKYWQNVRNVPVERNRAKAEEEARAAARAQAEAEANDLASVPEWGEDTPQAARDRGFRRESDHKIERQKPLKATTGNEVDVRFSQKDVVKGKVAVVDASQLQASHVNRRRNPRYFLDEAQPKERTDEASLMASHRIAQDVRPAEITGSATAYSGAPVVNTRGEVIQGNNRTDALKRMYDEDQYKESAEKYKQYLMDHAEEFGLNPEDIAKMKHPVLVNMVEVSDEEAIRLGQMSAADTESGGVERIRPQQTRQKMDDRQMGVFLRILLNDGNDQTLSISELIANNGIEAVKYLHQIGAISDTQMESAVSNGALTDEAKTDIKNLLFETVFHGAPTTLREIFNSMPKAAQRAILATAWRDASSDAKNSMIGEIQKSIYAWNDMRTSFGEELKASKSKENTRLLVGNWMQQLIFNTATGQPERVTEKYSNFAIELATRYFTDKQTELQDMFNALFDQIQGTSDNLFDPEGSVPKSLGEAIKKVLGIDYKPLNKKSDVNRKRQTGSNGVDRNDKKSEGGQSGSAGDTEGGEQGPQGARAADSGRGTKEDATGRQPRDLAEAGNGTGQRSGSEEVSRRSDAGVRQSGQAGGLNEQDADAFLSKMEDNAVEIPNLELNPANWLKEFGEDGVVTTPIAEVKMGANQIAKLFEKGRSEQFGMIKPTLEHPLVIIEVPSNAVEGETERGTSWLFVKTFLDKNGEKIYYFKSVTVKKDGLEVSVSSHFDRSKRIKDALIKGKLLYRFDGGAQTEHRPADVSVTASPESAQGNKRGVWRTPKDAAASSAEKQGLDYEQPNEAEAATKGSGITPQSTPSAGKNKKTSDANQGKEKKSSGKSDEVQRGKDEQDKKKKPKEKKETEEPTEEELARLGKAVAEAEEKLFDFLDKPIKAEAGSRAREKEKEEEDVVFKENYKTKAALRDALLKLPLERLEEFNDPDKVPSWLKELKGKVMKSGQRLKDVDYVISKAYDEKVRRERAKEEFEKRLKEQGPIERIEPRDNNVTPFDFVDKKHDILKGVYHDKGYIVGSDGHVLFAMREDYPKSLEGKVTDKDGNEVSVKYPNWRGIVQNVKDDGALPVDVEDLHRFAAGVCRKDKSDEATIAFKDRDGEVRFVRAKQLNMFLIAAKMCGAEVRMGNSGTNQVLSFSNDKGTGVMAQVVGVTELFYAYDGARKGEEKSEEGSEEDFYNMVDALYTSLNFDKAAHQRDRYNIGKTPDWMKRIGILGQYFSISFKNIKTHLGKDTDHNMTREAWHELPNAIQHPFLITKYKGASDRFRLYVNILHNEHYVAVGIDVKRVNQGKNNPILEVNSIKTVFAKGTEKIADDEVPVTWDENITPEQKALLRGHNLHEYPSIQELSADKGSENNDTKQGEEGKKHDKVHGEVEPVTEEEAELRDAVSDVLRNAGIEVIDDEKEGQRVLDMANGNSELKLMSVENAREIVKRINAITPEIVPDLKTDRATAFETYKALKPVVKDGATIEFYHGVFGKAWHGDDCLFGKIIPKLRKILENSVLAYSEEDNLAGKTRPDGTIHREHKNIDLYDNYVGKVKIGEKEYYVRITVQKSHKGGQGTHNFFVSDVSLYDNTAEDVHSTKNHLGMPPANGIVDAKLKQFFDYAKGKGEKISFLKAYHGSAADFDEFDTMNHLSEGEGSQVYGAGTYVTDHKGLGKKYAKIAQNYTRMYKGEPIDEDPTKLDPYRTAADIVKVYGNMKEARAWGKRLLNYAADEKTREFREKILDILEHSAAKDFSHQSFLYTVEIPDDNGKNYLDWDGRVDRYLDQFGISVKEYEENDMVSIGDAYLYLSRKLGSDKAASEMLSKAGYTGIKVHAARTSGDKRYQQNWNYVIFNDDDVKIGDKVKFFRTADGEVYGFTVGGKIYIDPRIAKADTPIHEYAHLWAEALRRVNPKEWQNVVSLMKECKAVWEQVKREYPELTTDDEIADEVLAHYSGKRGAERLRAEMRKAMDGEKSMIKKAGIARAFDALKEAIKMAWKHVAEDLLHIHFTSAEEVADKVLYDLLNKRNPRKAVSEADRLDEEYMQAVKDGDMDKAQRMVDDKYAEYAKRHSIDRDKAIALFRSIAKQYLENNYEGDDLGIRYDERMLVPEDVFPNSHELFQDYMEDENGNQLYPEGEGPYSGLYDAGELPGTSTIGISDYGELDEEKLEKAFDAKYWGNYIYLVAGEFVEEGYDEGEYLLSNAKVLSVLSIPDGQELEHMQFTNKSKEAVTYDDEGNVIPLSKRFDETNPDIRYQFVGEKGAASADRAEEATTRLDNLSVARKMEEAGKDAHNIKMATGWERGADEKWRYEIPDFRNIDPRGNIDFFKNNPDYKRYFDLIAKSNKAYFFNGEFTKEEERELSALDRKLHGQEYQTFRNPDKLTLKDYMDAPELFKAYPQLRNLPVKIEALPDNTEGAYTYQDGAPVIKISKGIMDSALAGVTIPFKRVMAHEIQHAIQLEEGFAKGGSIYSVRGDIEDNVSEMRPSYDWTSREGSKAIRLKNAASKLEFAKKIAANPEDYVNDPLTLVRLSMNGHKPLETIKKMPDADKIAAIKRLASNYWWEVVDDFANGLGEQVGMELPHNPYPEDGSEMSDEQWEKVNKASRNVPYADEMIAALRKRASAIEDYVDEHGMSSEEMSDYLRKNRALERRDDTELYASLAGEVEARNAARRVAMTDEQRRRNLASDTEDVSREDQIYLYDSFGIARSEEANDNGKAHYRDGEESDIEAVNKRFNKELEMYENGEVPIGTRFDLGMPSEVLESAGFPYLPISMRASLLSRKAGMERHPFVPSDLKDLVKAIQRPLAIFRYSKDNMRNLIVDVTHGDKNFLVGVTLDYKKGDIEVNSVSGLFPKDSHEWIKWIQDGKAIRIDQKKKVLDLIDSLRTNPAESERIGLNLSSVAKIVENFDNPTIAIDQNSDAGEEDNLYRTSGEIDAEYPNWLEGTTTDSGKHTTQVAGTRKTYGHVGDWIERHIGKDARILDASSGMGYGTKDLRQRGFNIEDVEPYQSEERKKDNPATYSSYGDVEGKYDYIISNAVLNVIPDDWRSDVLHDMASRLKAGGRLFINTRKAGEEKGIKDKIELDSPQEVLVKRNGKIASYQRFFTPQELKEYVEKELGEGYKVEIANEENSGTKGLAAVVVTKESQGESTGAKAASSSVQRMTSAVNDLAQKLHLNNVEIVTEPITVRDKNGKVHRPKGYFNPKTGKITISIANNADVDDAVSTLLHEAVAHYGLRKLLGENFDTFLDNVFANVNDNIRKKIEDAAKKRYDGDTRTATEEYLASLAEDENFEEARKQGVWDKIKDLFFELLHKVGVKLKRKLTDNDLRYMLWRSYENLKEGKGGRTMLQEAADAAKRDELGIRNEAAETASQAEENREVGEKSSLWGKHDMVSLAERAAAGEDPELLFRDSVGPQDETARKIYDKRADAALMKIREAWQDSMINVKNLQDAVLEQRGEKIEDWENAYMQENNLHGVSRAESECFTDNFYKPLLEEVNKAAKGWYDRRTGRITIVAGNHTSVADAESTLLHEAVAHYGLRQLLGDTVNLLLAAAAYNFKRAKRSRFCTFLSNST